jgi:hypothetical protein
MRTLLAVMIFAISLTISLAEGNLKNVNTSPKAGIKLKIMGEDGTNGSAVAWHPTTKLYYTIIAGNEDFPLEVFDESGKHVQSSTTMADMRGLWFNDVYEVIEGNTYEFHNIVSYDIDEDGLMYGDAPYEELYELPVHDHPQSVLCLNTRDGVYAWFDTEYTTLQLIDMESGDELDVIELDLSTPLTKLNKTTVIYTGVEGAEYGLLNFEDKEIYLIDDDNGQVTKTIKLPKSQPTYKTFNFSFANGNIWLFDTDARVWTGYALLKK